MDFNTFKIGVIEATGLAKDALHIYVGLGVYILSLLLLRPIFRKYSIRAVIALLLVTLIALLGEYLDNRHIIESQGLSALNSTAIKASIRDLINTCLLSYVLFALTMWTKVFQSTTAAKPLIKRYKKTDYS